MAPAGIQEDSFPPLKGAIKMRRLIAEAIDRFLVGDVRGDTWFSLFDEGGKFNLLKEDLEELCYLGRSRTRALGTQSEWWSRLVIT